MVKGRASLFRQCPGKPAGYTELPIKGNPFQMADKAAVHHAGKLCLKGES